MSEGKRKLIALLGAGAAAILTPFVAGWEGKENDPYFDLVGKQTVCFGETDVPMQHYTDAQCEDMLAGSLAKHAMPVLKRNPELLGHDAQLAAAASLSYNIGPAAYSRSTVAKRFSAGNWKAACDAFLMWRFAGGKEVPGLLNRRRAERKLCLRGI